LGGIAAAQRRSSNGQLQSSRTRRLSRDTAEVPTRSLPVAPADNLVRSESDSKPKDRRTSVPSLLSAPESSLLAESRTPSPVASAREDHVPAKVARPSLKRGNTWRQRGSFKITGTQTMCDNVTHVKMGGRSTSLLFPPEVAQEVHQASEHQDVIRRMQSQPAEELVLEYAYGYNGSCARNLHALGPSTCAYNVGALGVIFDFRTNEQRFFGGHSAEVTAIAFCERLRLCATGQRMCKTSGDPPRISLWGVDEAVPWETQRILGHDSSIYSLSFSHDGSFLFSAGSNTSDFEDGAEQPTRSTVLKAHPTSPVYVWRVQQSYKTADESSSVQKKSSGGKTGQLQLMIPNIAAGHVMVFPHPMDTRRIFVLTGWTANFVSCSGEQWASADNVVVSHVERLQAMVDNDGARFNCATWIPGEKSWVVVGTTGMVLVLDQESSSCLRTVPVLHGSSVNFVVMLDSGELACGGEDGGISFLNHKLTGFARPRAAVCDHAGRSVFMTNAQCFKSEDGMQALLVGTPHGRIAQVTFAEDWGVADVKVVQQSPSGRSDVTALSTTPSDKCRLAIGDRRGFVYFFDSRRCHLLPMEAYHCITELTCLTWSPDGRLLIAGLSNGKIEAIYTTEWDMMPMSPPKCVFITLAVKGQYREATAEKVSAKVEKVPVSTIQFSPGTGRYLACGSSISGVITVLRVHCAERLNNIPDYHVSLMHIFSGNASSILTLQFSNAESELVSNSRDGQTLCWEVESGKHISPTTTVDMYSGSKFRLTMSWPMIGIWSQSTLRSTALVAEASPSWRLVAVGDEGGRVKLHRFPVPIADSTAREYYGHSGRVTCLEWISDDRMISAGAERADGVLQWRLGTASPCKPSPAPTLVKEQCPYCQSSQVLTSLVQKDNVLPERPQIPGPESDLISLISSMEEKVAKELTLLNARDAPVQTSPFPTPGLVQTPVAAQEPKMREPVLIDRPEMICHETTQTDEVGSETRALQTCGTQTGPTVAPKLKTVMTSSASAESFASNSLQFASNAVRLGAPGDAGPIVVPKLKTVMTSSASAESFCGPSLSNAVRLIPTLRGTTVRPEEDVMLESPMMQHRLLTSRGSQASSSRGGSTASTTFLMSPRLPSRNLRQVAVVPRMRIAPGGRSPVGVQSARTLTPSASAPYLGSPVQSARAISPHPRPFVVPVVPVTVVPVVPVTTVLQRSLSPLQRVQVSPAQSFRGIISTPREQPFLVPVLASPPQSFRGSQGQATPFWSSPYSTVASPSSSYRLHSPKRHPSVSASPPIAAPAASLFNLAVEAEAAGSAADSDYFARLYSADGRLLAEATVYLYHPPFRLDAVISYVTEGESSGEELFTMPRGWGVLRSRRGLLLWLRIIDDAGLTGAAQRSVPKGQEVRFELRCRGALASSALDLGATVAGVASSRVQLTDDECLFHVPTAGVQLRLKLQSSFDGKAKRWLASLWDNQEFSGTLDCLAPPPPATVLVAPAGRRTSSPGRRTSSPAPVPSAAYPDPASFMVHDCDPSFRLPIPPTPRG